MINELIIVMSCLLLLGNKPVPPKRRLEATFYPELFLNSIQCGTGEGGWYKGYKCNRPRKIILMFLVTFLSRQYSARKICPKKAVHAILVSPTCSDSDTMNIM